MTRHNYKRNGLLVVIIILSLIYAGFDPSTNPLFPKCPFYQMTDYKCPGCGSQRAIHDILNLNIGSAWRHNPLILISIPYLLFASILSTSDFHNLNSSSFRKFLVGPTTIWIVLVLIIAFWIGRNF